MDSPIPLSKDKPVVLTAENYAGKKKSFRFSIVNPKIAGLITVLLLLVGGVGAGVYLIQTPQQTVTQATASSVDLNFQPSQTSIEEGLNTNIDIFANANDNKITSVKLAVDYDQATLELKSITPKQFLPKVLIEPEISSGSATVSLGTDGNTGITGSGILASLNFRATGKPGSTQVKINSENTQINLLDNNTQTIPNLGVAQILITPSAGKTSDQNASDSALLDNQSLIPEVDTTITTTSASASFDFNDDSLTNAIDLSILYSAWGTPETDIQKKSDVNGDGIVNGLDYSQFLPNYNQ